MHPSGEAVVDWGWREDGLIVLPSLEDGAWWESVRSTVFPARFANDGDNENWLFAVWWHNENSIAIKISVKTTMATDAEVVSIRKPSS